MSAPPDLDLSAPRRVHLVAIGGAGMSGIATLLAQSGHEVSGSDAVDSPVLDRLRNLGVTAWVGHDAGHVASLDELDVVGISTAVPDDNPEVVAAHDRGVPVLRRTGLLPALAAVRPLLSVAGTHGKTTTTSLLVAALRGAGEDPSFLTGAPVAALGGVAAAWRPGPWLVLEADESDGSFLSGPRAGAIVTNVEPDHLEHWGGWEALKDGFRRFLAGTDGPRVVCADDEVAAELGAESGAATYGTAEGSDHRVTDLELGPDGSRFRVVGPGATVDVALPLPGLHNALDAAGALALVAELGLDVAAAAAGLSDFGGVARRFERKGVAAGVTVVDDYAHLPTEVRAALAAGASGGYGRVVAVFQPHRYSRTQALWREFGEAFGDADLLVLTDVYPAGEAPRPGVTGKLLVDATLDHHPHRPLAWMPSLDDVVRYLVAALRPGDLLMTVGAGDVTTVGPRVLEQLEAAGA
ncbi:UDP-N-acetylmuramate--L-alanine ligase [Dermatobacter hominis]|uniref:UDP-N-acetylmuramate--L-alanine ligase n=1 Tax=Dermatobacter hominis TaxID=2884263 RepID=UPI001D11520F|nr:UDP-N-acetylmuramate--L-alanine ligase [Dermatobacter hominis]UDY35977.1 UDP-N-acetylmuramate--L-alanine ligase [Dermatobacter hominis]